VKPAHHRDRDLGLDRGVTGAGHLGWFSYAEVLITLPGQTGQECRNEQQR
jgi:hypothetical protein